MKKTLFTILVIPALLLMAMPSYSKTNAMEDAIAKTSRKISNSQDIPSDAKFIFTDFRETASGKKMNLGFAIEDELCISLIREMPGRLAVRHEKNQPTEENRGTETVFDSLEAMREYAESLHASYIIGGNYYFDKEYATISVNVIRAEDGMIIFSERIKIRISDLSKKLQPSNAD